MLLTGDYHTHTIYSHGKGTVLENAVRAKEIGLKEIAITDHGFEQMAFGLRHNRMPQLIADCKEAERITGIRVLVGTEANLCDEDGRTDLREEDYKDFALVREVQPVSRLPLSLFSECIHFGVSPETEQGARTLYHQCLHQLH